eukprot:CAMPEP_0113830442 /NCGR_PEP_ID=MMETSP0328-20130328/6332_1 /TAXON_ID=39455 /ORGANISM="Alexandrium minutum" /LENGTH=103 /DNA_ID=CAMNT_0000798557 /DNA_START=327 /DNA_END=635 /DNA_ORIENTATION=- /assembly_acc=CAM_ASM_000350
MRWKCVEGHTWTAQYKKVVHDGSWCPECRRGRSERDVRGIFHRIFLGLTFRKRRPSFLRSSKGGYLELDGYCEELQLAFEYNGEQHYSAVHYWNRRGGFAELV